MGMLLSEPAKTKKTTSGESQYFLFAGSQMQGWRNIMEDGHIFKANILDDISLFGVFDGHKGQEVVEFVEQYFIKELLENDSFGQKEYARALEETFLRIDDMLNQQNYQDKTKSAFYSSCSANVCLIVGKDIYIANAGHSRSILYRNGQNFDLSSDHTLDNLQEQDRVKQAGELKIVNSAYLGGEKLTTRGLGGFQNKRDKTRGQLEQLVIALPEVVKLEIEQGDKFILMGTHGLFQTLPNLEMLEFINQSTQGKQVSEELLAETVEQLMDRLLAPDQKSPGINNMTALIIYFKQN